MSRIAEEIYSILKRYFPNYTILTEYYVKYKGIKLFFDFYIKEFGALIEVQGRQHTYYVHHFHGCMDNFRAQKRRDNLKLQYVQEHDNLCIARFFYDEKITEDLVIGKIYKAIERGFHE